MGTGSLVITEAVAQSAVAQYVGVIVYFSGNSLGTDCVDATAYAGIGFTISGTVNANCTVQFSINDSEHEVVGNDAKASGATGSYAPQVFVTVPAQPTTLRVPFTGPGAPSGGMPATAIDPKKLTGVEWQLTIASGTGMCMANLTISNVTFY
jgi:hypothetical protein